MTLEILWFCLLAFFWTAYFVLEGFDFGVGMLLPVVGRNEDDRSTMLESVGPHWDGNEVWLVIAGGATFAAFPVWYATMFSGFYLALLLILVFLIARVLSFEWREKAEAPGVEGVLGLDEHDLVGRSAAPVGHRAGEPPARRPDRVRPDLRRRLRRPLQRLLGRRGDRPLPPLRAPRRGLSRPPHASGTSASVPVARRRSSHPRPRSSAPASSSGRSSSPATSTTRASSPASSPSLWRPSPPWLRSSSCGRGTSAGRSSPPR